MTIEIDLFTVGLYALILASDGLLLLTAVGLNHTGIDEAGFLAHLQKLIAAGATDRAIKLCNAEDNVFAVACGRLIALSVRKDSDLRQAFDEGIALIRAWRAKWERPRWALLNLAVAALTNLALWQLNPTGRMVVALFSLMFCSAMVRAGEWRLVVKSAAYEAALLRLLGMLEAKRGDQ